MQLVCYIDRRDFPRLSSKEGYWKSDERADDVQRFLNHLGIQYVTPFVCIGVLPDQADPYDTLHPLHVFGDTPVMLCEQIAEEVAMACPADVQNTAVNGLKAHEASGTIAAGYKSMIVDLSSASVPDKVARVKALCSHFERRTYPEVRIYRTITWNDVEP